jgi:predicted phosphodiesterase
MSVAALYDIHGNLPALEAALKEIRPARVDQVLIGGDVFPGPMPRECLALLRSLDIPVHYITGNGDREVLTRMRNLETDWYKSARDEWRAPIDWTAQQLSSEDADFIASWPATLTLNLDGLGEVLFCHATPHNDIDIFTRLTPEDRLLPIFAEVAEKTVICGHTHMQFDRVIGNTRVINAGSLGMPFGRTGADWLLLGPNIQLRHTDYDLAKAAERIRAIGYPHAEQFVQQYVLSSPPEGQMLKAYSAFELK